jgi:hypothetical protein
MKKRTGAFVLLLLLPTLGACRSAGLEADFRLDCEPGTSDAVRPGAFTMQTQAYRRPTSD